VTFWEHFLRLLPHRPVPALAALYWHLTRRKVRARNRLRVASADLTFAYEMWMKRNENASATAQEVLQSINTWRSVPSFSIVLHGAAKYSEDQRCQSIASIERQLYPNWKLVDSTGVPIGDTITNLAGEYVVPLQSGDQLSPVSLFRFAKALQDNPDAGILYADEDRLDARGRRVRPWFKPRWNEELFLAQDYLSSAIAIEGSLAKNAAVRSGGSLAALVVEAASTAQGRIVHVPHVMVHTANAAVPSPDRIGVVARHLQERGAAAVPGPFGTVKVEWPLPGELPLVSMIVPTKDKLELLRPCVDSILSRTDYPNFEVIIVDNASVEERTAKYIKEIGKNPKVHVLTYPGPFNYSAINNFAVPHARGAYLCLLNNDTEVVGTSWLTELMRYAVRPDVGAVGAKLLYGDGSIQHAGVVVGIGDSAGHAHRFLPAGQSGYFRMAHVAQFITAVTGACLAVNKKKFESVGGLDESGLAVAYNDVDFCLRLERAGWRNVYVPHAVLLHHESKSRGSDMASKNVERYRRELKLLQDRWGTETYQDPLHNPNLDRYSETFVLRL
jgi:GT2 family glycosyltransferase